MAIDLGLHKVLFGSRALKGKELTLVFCSRSWLGTRRSAPSGLAFSGPWSASTESSPVERAVRPQFPSPRSRCVLPPAPFLHFRSPLARSQVDLPPPRTDIVSSNGTPLVDPFPFLCRLLLLLGQVTDSMNHSNPTARSPRSPRPLPRPFQNELAQFQADLPPELYFNIHNFQAFASAKQSQCFLLLSIWHQAVLLAVHEAGLLFPTFESGEEYEYGERALSQSCAVSISDMLCL